MNAATLAKQFSSLFDAVGVIKTSSFVQASIAMGKKVDSLHYPTMVVVGLAYPRRTIPHTSTHVVGSFYTFGNDYHKVLKKRLLQALDGLPHRYEIAVDNHPLDERLAATLAGIGFFAKNQLIIHPTFGSYIFLGIALVDVELHDEFKIRIDDHCGTCTKCITACPVGALSEEGYEMEKCISYFNQAKQKMTPEQAKANYCLFGCDICQMVCPKNLGRVNPLHPEFELTGKEAVSLIDLFTLSERQFASKYEGMSFLWKGKTILMRNALTLVDNEQQIKLRSLLKRSTPDWFDPAA